MAATSHPSDNVTGCVTGASDVVSAVRHQMSEGVINYDDYHRITLGVSGVNTPLAIIGILTNLLSVAAFLRMRRSVTSTYFILLSCVDLAYLAIALPPLAIVLARGTEALSSNYMYLSYFNYLFYFPAVALRRTSICITTLISLDRCLVIAFPMKARVLSHLRRPKLYTLLLLILVFSLSFDRSFHYRVVHVEKEEEGEEGGGGEGSGGADSTGGKMIRTSAYLDHREAFRKLAIFRYALFVYLPLVITTVTTVAFIVILKRRSRKSGRCTLRRATSAGPGRPISHNSASEGSATLPDSVLVLHNAHHPVSLHCAKERTGLSSNRVSTSTSLEVEIPLMCDSLNNGSDQERDSSIGTECEEQEDVHTFVRGVRNNSSDTLCHSLQLSVAFTTLAHSSAQTTSLRTTTRLSTTTFLTRTRPPQVEESTRQPNTTAVLPQQREPNQNGHPASCEALNTCWTSRHQTLATRATFVPTNSHRHHPQPTSLTPAFASSSSSSSPSLSFFRLSWQRSVAVVVYATVSTLLATPDAITLLLTSLLADYRLFGREHFLVVSMSALYCLLDVISAGINFFVYFATGSVFRAQVRRILCKT